MKARHGGLLFGQSFGHRVAGQKGESQWLHKCPSLSCLSGCSGTARWMQIMNVNPASLFRGQTPKKSDQSGCQHGKSCLFALCIRLGSASFFWGTFSVCFSLAVCVREQDSSWAHSSSRGEDFCPLFVVMQHRAAFSDEGGEKKKMGCQYDCDIWMIYLVPLLSNLTLTLSVNSEPCLRCSCC